MKLVEASEARLCKFKPKNDFKLQACIDHAHTSDQKGLHAAGGLDNMEKVTHINMLHTTARSMLVHANGPVAKQPTVTCVRCMAFTGGIMAGKLRQGSQQTRMGERKRD